MSTILEIRDLRKAFIAPDGSRRDVLSMDHWSLEGGSQSALVGGSGSGKSTLIHLIAGLQRPDSGQINIGGINVPNLPEAGRDRWRAQNLGIIFQTFNLLQGLTAFENVWLAGVLAGNTDRNRAKELLKRVGLGDRLYDRPETLSVGQQQRVAVARALVNEPSLILADEPTGSLDPEQCDAAVTLIRELCRESGSTLLFVSHDPRLIDSFESVVRLSEINGVPA